MKNILYLCLLFTKIINIYFMFSMYKQYIMNNDLIIKLMVIVNYNIVMVLLGTTKFRCT